MSIKIDLVQGLERCVFVNGGFDDTGGFFGLPGHAISAAGLRGAPAIQPQLISLSPEDHTIQGGR